MRVIKKSNIIRIFLMSGIVVVLYFSFSRFNRRSSEIVISSSTQSLKETSELYAHTVEVKLKDQLSMLESQARYFKDIDMNDYSAIKKTIISTRGIGEFKRIAVANESGMTINYQGNTSGNIYLYEFFTEAMSTKQPSVSKNFIIDEDGDNVLSLAVPIIQNGESTGVITGTYSYSVLRNLFSVVSFNGKGYSQVVTKDGQLIVASSADEKFSNTINVLHYYHNNKNISDSDYDKIRSNMKKNVSDLINLDTAEGKKLCYYTPVGVNDWYVLSYVDADYVLEKKTEISKNVYILISILIGCFALIVIMLVQLQREYLEVEKDVEKYAIANEQNGSWVFEYDIKNKKIKFSGNYDYVLGKIHNPIQIDEMRKLFVNIHEDDSNVLNHLLEFFESGEENFTAEVRFKCTDGLYKWFRLSGTAVKDKDTKPVKFVGNFTNVDAQMMHEQELRHIAETDLLSGLLNKSFFHKNVSKFLSKSSEDSKGALFIIDLDNFKQINDTLGHSMGDIAIRDTAQKLNLIFSQKDILGRIGGDEFCVFMNLENISDNMFAKILMEKAASLNENLEEIYNNEKSSVKVSASVGISLWPSQGKDYEELFQKADSALYYVKKNGKNGNAIFSEKMKGLS